MQAKKKSVLDNAIVAFLIALGVLTFVGYVYRDLWIYLFSAAVAWVVSDFVITLIVRGGSGIAQIPLWGTQIQAKGRSFMAFCFGIFVATAISAFFSETLFKVMEFGVAVSVTAAGVSLSPYQTEWTTIFVSSLVCSILVFGDFNTRFYGRGNREES
jgi:hypothetical protein